MDKLNIVITIILSTLLVSCADSVDVSSCINEINQAGFWSGVWHGMISIFSFVGSIFNDDIAIYDVNNNGLWYDFGYVGGLGIIINGIKIILTIIRG